MAVIARGEAVCQDSGAAFSLPLASCTPRGHVYPAEAEGCAGCGQPISLVARVANRQLSQPSPGCLEQAQARALKQQGERSSAARIAVFQRAEQLRIQELQRLNAARGRQDGRLLLAEAAVPALVLIALALVSFFVTSGA